MTLIMDSRLNQVSNFDDSDVICQGSTFTWNFVTRRFIEVSVAPFRMSVIKAHLSSFQGSQNPNSLAVSDLVGPRLIKDQKSLSPQAILYSHSASLWA